MLSTVLYSISKVVVQYKNTPLVTCPLTSDWLDRHDLKATVDHHHRLSHTPLVSSGELSFASLLPFVIFPGFLKVQPTLSC
ncbi:hypothetical protein VN97_g742 [Penicillium thymicola]|uniref:Uncharacterized protein n=1 Tax=Penicillium thymicola TaxID=293382 RepID=A0AAI9TS70_PENTH|nr:hypothetical protein VN97_g742 [Penicillium thymicola]